MLGNGFDLYHGLLSHYDDFITISKYLSEKYRCIVFNEDFESKNIYSELLDLAKTNEAVRRKLLVYKEAYKKQ